MRMRAVMALLGIGLLLAILTGCEDNTNTFTLAGSITGLPNGTSTLQLMSGDNVVRTADITGPDATFSFSEVADGTYVLVITQTGNPVRKLYGPVVINGSNVTGLNIPTYTAATLPAGVTVPADGTATVAGFSINQAGAESTATVTVDALPTQTGNPAVITAIPTPGPHNITVTAGGTTVFFASIAFAPDTVTVVNALTSPVTTPGTFAISGQVLNDGVAQPNVAVALFQGDMAVGITAFTDANGNFQLIDVAPGTYTLQFMNNGVNTLYGPVTVVSSNVAGLIVNAPTATTLPVGVTTPTNGTSTLLVTATNAANTTVPVVVQVDENTPSAAANPVILTGLTPGKHTVTITDPATATSTTLVVFLPLDMVTVLRTDVAP